MITINFSEGVNNKEKAEDMLDKCKFQKDDLVGKSFDFMGAYTPNLADEDEDKLLVNIIKDERVCELPGVREIENRTRRNIKEKKSRGRTPHIAKLDLSPQNQSRSGVPYVWSYFGHMDITSREHHYAFLWAYYHPEIEGKAEVDYSDGSVKIKIR